MNGPDPSDDLAEIYGLIPGKDMLDVDVGGRIEGGVTVAGALKMFALADVEQAEPWLQPILRRFQKWAAGVIAAESIRAQPRELGELIFEAFGGEELEAAIDQACAGDHDAFERTFKRLLDRAETARA